MQTSPMSGQIAMHMRMNDPNIIQQEQQPQHNFAHNRIGQQRPAPGMPTMDTLPIAQHRRAPRNIQTTRTTGSGGLRNIKISSIAIKKTISEDISDKNDDKARKLQYLQKKHHNHSIGFSTGPI